MAVWQFDLDFKHVDDGRDLSAVTTELLVVQLAQVMGPNHLMLEGWHYFGDKTGTARVTGGAGRGSGWSLTQTLRHRTRRGPTFSASHSTSDSLNLG